MYFEIGYSSGHHFFKILFNMKDRGGGHVHGRWSPHFSITHEFTIFQEKTKT